MYKLSKFCFIGLGLFSLQLLLASLSSVSANILNNPHDDAKPNQKVYYSAFAEQPRTLDPAESYSSNEVLFTGQIYEPPLQYHFLKRPYELIPLTVEQVPQPVYVDAAGNPLPQDAPASKVAWSIYTIKLKPGIYYQPHPAFAKDANGQYLYHQLTPEDIEDIYTLNDFTKTGTRELIAEDYVYQIKRMAHPTIHSPIFGLMSEYIVALPEYGKTLQQAYKKIQTTQEKNNFLDLRKYNLPGVEVIDRYIYRIKIKGKYPQFKFWLAMPFFAPIPWEADYFYQQEGLDERNITLDWYPVGTGPYMLTQNNPNRQMVLERNPNFHGEKFPSEGAVNDQAAGYLANTGRSLPMIDKYIFSLEKESIPRWNKFLQGYYDQSSIGSDSFDQAIQVDQYGNPQLTPQMQAKNLYLTTSVSPSIFYLGFNMLDPIVGGNSERARKLRQAISIALDYEEFIAIFVNGRGIAAQGLIPPGIFGHQVGEQGINPIVYNWQDGHPQRKSITTAKQLLREAGYPNGIDPKTGKPLVLNYDVTASLGPDDNARLAWMRKQFAKLGIQLQIRRTQYNRFQEKMRTGNAQIFSWGWLADYPDPENFLFLLYGPNGKVKYRGENASNYVNKEFDRLFDQMKTMPNGPERQAVINKMQDIVRQDAPIVWGYHPKDFLLSHAWNSKVKPNPIANNGLKYRNLNVKLRDELRKKWNKPVFYPFIILAVLLLIMLIAIIFIYWNREHKPKARK